MNMAVLDELEAAYPSTDFIFLESGGDNLTLTFSPELVDHSIYVIDVAGGDKIPRKRRQGLVQAELLVINKTDLAPFVGADLGIMDRDARLVRGKGPFLFTDCRAGRGMEAVIEHLELARAAAGDGDRVGRLHDHHGVPHGHTHGIPVGGRNSHDRRSV